MTVDPNEVHIATISDLARGGSGVTKLESGEVVFVPFTAPGDQIKFRITERNKSYSHGELVEIITPSPLRVQAPCKVFTVCGGCTWQHLPYSLQFETKTKGLLHALKRVGISAEKTRIPELDLFPATETYLYRNRVQLRGNPTENTLGFFARESNEIVSIDRCEIAEEKINERLAALKLEAAQKFSEPYKVEVEVDAQQKVQVSWNQRQAALGFRQVHSEQNKNLQNWVKESALLSRSKGRVDEAILFDLYGGEGNLSQSLLKDFSEIHCVDLSVPPMKPRHLQSHFYYHRSAVSTWLKKLDTRVFQGRPVTVVMDPPREGISNEFGEILRVLSQLNTQGIILIGCDVDSFARDLQRLYQKDFKLEKLGVLDLFPQTPHVESLALLFR